MNKQEAELEALKALKRFEQLPEITPLAAWDAALMARIKQSGQPARSKKAMLLTATAALLLAFNAFYAFSLLNQPEVRPNSPIEAYHTVADELFINPINN